MEEEEEKERKGQDGEGRRRKQRRRKGRKGKDEEEKGWRKRKKREAAERTQSPLLLRRLGRGLLGTSVGPEARKALLSLSPAPCLFLPPVRMRRPSSLQGLLLWPGPLLLLLHLPFWGCGAHKASFPLPVGLHPFQLLQTVAFQNANDTDIMEATAFLGDVETHSLDSQKIRFLQPWAKSAFTPQEWDMLQKIINAYFIGFKKTINDMAKAFNASYPFVIQSLIFCEIESNGTKRGFYNAAANGEVMVTFDADHAAWVAQKKDKLTVSVQDHLNKDKGTVSTLRSLLSNQCIEALKSFLQTGKATLDRQEKKPGVIVPIIIGLLVALVVAVSAILLYRWKKHRDYEGINQA